MLYIGLMSGTSADGIDLALVDFSSETPTLKAKYYQAYDESTQIAITELYQSSANEIDKAFSLDITLALQFASAIKEFLIQENLSAYDIEAIGNHGQTIRHRPCISNIVNAPFTLQIGCSQTLATSTGIRVIGQFRRKDMALGGQGAPLVPAFHKALFTSQTKDTFIVNIGGIANITYLPLSKDKHVIGYDTGPGNALLDAWFHSKMNERYDHNGEWSSSGSVDEQLLSTFLSDDYFNKSFPKSTGREYFNLAWIKQKSTNFDTKPEDVQATLVTLTAQTIADEIQQLSTNFDVYICGGGTQNQHLVHELKQQLTPQIVLNINALNIDSDSFEAMAFSWLAYAFDKKIISNIPAVTGASKEAVLGNSFLP